jgi:hypothetical protein
MSYAVVGETIELRRGPRRGERVVVLEVCWSGGDEYYVGKSPTMGRVRWNWKAVLNVSRGEV